MTTLRLMEESESESMVDVHHRKSYAQLGSFGTGHTNQRMTTNSPLYTHASLGERTRGTIWYYHRSMPILQSPSFCKFVSMCASDDNVHQGPLVHRSDVFYASRAILPVYIILFIYPFLLAGS